MSSVNSESDRSEGVILAKSMREARKVSVHTGSTDFGKLTFLHVQQDSVESGSKRVGTWPMQPPAARDSLHKRERRAIQSGRQLPERVP